MIYENYQVPPLSTPERLSDHLVGIFPIAASRKGIKKRIKKGHVSIDGRVGYTGDWLYGGEQIELLLPAIEVNSKKPNLQLTVHFEDDHLAVVEKPAGLLTSGNKWMTLANALPANLTPSRKTDALVYPQPAHRLDYATSGLVVVGKTASCLTRLGELFARRMIRKNYLAVVIGEIPERGNVEQSIDGKPASSTYERLDRQSSPRFGWLNLVRLSPATGRRHQLRIHLAALGCPILGDQKYGIEGLVLKGKGLYLHAHQLSFIHPITSEEIEVTSKVAKKFTKLFAN
ncbi:RNA pseudouridine synthase [Lewinellaceae bacterium SD302]|nr:RNA pseudouridine synthase [Lewinellaceae bacterium SD302]